MKKRKDIFGNVYTVPTNKPRNNFEQRLREAKAKKKYREFQAQQRREQIAQIRSTAKKTRAGLTKIGSKTKVVYKRATDKRLSGLREKLRGSIYKK